MITLQMQTVTLIPGDGIGPEISTAVMNIFEAAQVRTLKEAISNYDMKILWFYFISQSIFIQYSEDNCLIYVPFSYNIVIIQYPYIFLIVVSFKVYLVLCVYVL